MLEELFKDLNISEEEVELEAEYLEICNSILFWMKEKGITQSALATKMGVDKSQVSRWLGGVHFMNAHTLLKIRKLIGENIFDIEQTKEQRKNEKEISFSIPQHTRPISKDRHAFKNIRSSTNYSWTKESR